MTRQHTGAFDVGVSISNLAQGGYAYSALVEVANDPRSKSIMPALTLSRLFRYGKWSQRMAHDTSMTPRTT